jgi:DNA-binding NarL/FixJ family response regulator
MPKKIKLLITCGETLSCLALYELLSKEEDFVIVKETTTSEDAIRSFKKSHPDIFFLCSHFLIEKGTDIISKASEESKRTKIVVFNSHFTEDQEMLLVKEGVTGILNANLDPPDLIKALRKVHEGELWLRRGLIHSLIGGSSLDSNKVEVSEDSNPLLTERELEVLSLIAKDYKNREISYKLCISEATVKTHIHNIFRKLKVNDRLQAIFYAKKHILNGEHL